MKISKLVFQGSLVGLRFETPHGGAFDVDIETATKTGVSLADYRLGEIHLVERGNLLISQEEIERGIRAQDISGNTKHFLRLMEEASRTKPKSKVKARKEIEYKNGLAIFLLHKEEENAEYETLRVTYRVALAFKTKTAIRKVGKLLGYGFDTQDVLRNFERGRNTVKLHISGHDYMILNSEFGCGISLTKEGFVLDSANHYEGTHFTVKLVPPNFKVDYKGKLEYAQVGTSADGDPLRVYVDGIRQSLESGYYKYYPHINERSL